MAEVFRLRANDIFISGGCCMDEVYTAYYQSPIGTIEITGRQDGILSVMFLDGAEVKASEAMPVCLKQCINQLDQYFQGQRREFSVPLIMQGTDFQKRVWETLQTIPFGTTLSYRDLAVRIDNPKAVRAVGNANGKNLHSIIVPCHRVIGSQGGLTGYEGGLWRKEWLLAHERSAKWVTGTGRLVKQ